MDIHSEWSSSNFDNNSLAKVVERVRGQAPVCSPWLQTLASYVSTAPSSGDWLHELKQTMLLQTGKASAQPRSFGEEFLSAVAGVKGAPPQ